jgi:hypothetical protein
MTLTVMLAGLPALLFLKSRLPRSDYVVFAGMAVAQVVVFAAQIVLLGSLRPWYLIPGFLLACQAILLAADRLFAAAPRAAAWSCCAVALLVTGGYSFQAWFSDIQERTRWEFFEEVRRATPEDAVIYCYDYSGTAAFVSQRRILNGDGLVNSFDYADRYRSGSLGDYFERTKPSYYLETRNRRRMRLVGAALAAEFEGRHLFRLPPDALIVSSPHAEDKHLALYRFNPRTDYQTIR